MNWETSEQSRLEHFMENLIKRGLKEVFWLLRIWVECKNRIFSPHKYFVKVGRLSKVQELLRKRDSCETKL